MKYVVVENSKSSLQVPKVSMFEDKDSMAQYFERFNIKLDKVEVFELGSRIAVDRVVSYNINRV